MDIQQPNQDNLIDTTDSLEAIGVFRGWKNFLFVLVIICMILLQVSFWFVKAEWVRPIEQNEDKAAVKQPQKIEDAPEDIEKQQQDEIQKAVERVIVEPNEDSILQEKDKNQGVQMPKIKIKHMVWLVRFVNFILIIAALLYCLTIMFALKISLLGRLGGINHICRAFFLSLIALVLILPWQKFFGGIITGLIFTPEHLLDCIERECSNIFCSIIHYLRFVGLWLLVLLFLILSHIRSVRWARAMLRRLEII